MLRYSFSPLEARIYPEQCDRQTVFSCYENNKVAVFISLFEHCLAIIWCRAAGEQQVYWSLFSDNKSY